MASAKLPQASPAAGCVQTAGGCRRLGADPGGGHRHLLCGAPRQTVPVGAVPDAFDRFGLAMMAYRATGVT